MLFHQTLLSIFMLIEDDEFMFEVYSIIKHNFI